jgi:membrane protease YdiL (CAAX protease family)
MMSDKNPLDALKPNWREVATFLAVTFGLTFLLDLVLYLTVGYGTQVGTTMLLQVQMLIPAAVAIALQLFLFKDSPIYRLQERPRWFFYLYLVYALVFAALAVSVLVVSNTLYQSLVSLLSLGLSVGGLVFAVILRLVSGKEAFQRAGLAGGKAWHYVIFGIILVVLYGAMTGLNALFGLGQPADVTALLEQTAGSEAAQMLAMPNWALVVIIGLQSLLLGPFLGLLIAFGEEYGWRGYLQSELIKIGKVRGILLVGVIWGLWHAPVIMMGHNYPGYPLLGVLVMTLYTIGLGFFLGYAVLKSGSVWLAAYLHALNNGVASFLVVLVYSPDDPVFSFGVGLYGLIVWAIVVAALLIVGRKEWSTPAAPAVQEEAAAR